MSKRPHVRGHKRPNKLIKKALSGTLEDMAKRPTRVLVLTAKALKARFDKSKSKDEREAIITTISYINNIVQARATRGKRVQNER